MRLLSISEVSSLKPSSVAVQPGLFLDLIRNSKDRFSHIISLFPCQKINVIFKFDAHKQDKTINQIKWAEWSLYSGPRSPGLKDGPNRLGRAVTGRNGFGPK